MPDLFLKTIIKSVLISSFLTSYFSSVFSQIDTLVLNNNNTIVGEIKLMDRGILQIETDYSDSDFKIEWDEVVTLNTQTYFYVSLSNSKNYYGWLQSMPDSTIKIVSRDSSEIICSREEVVHMLAIKKGFKDRFSAEIDLGLSMTKSINLRQFTVGAMIGYKTEKWTSYVNYNTL